jgi:hypothetical protein
MPLQNQGHILNAFWIRKEKSSQKIKKHLSVSDKALVASFQASELIAQQKKAHTIGEELILPASKNHKNCVQRRCRGRSFERSLIK